MNKIYALGDVHGNHKSLLQCLERANVDKIHDTLILLGDVCDGYRSTKQVIETLLKYNTILVRGNHDSSAEGSGYSDFGWAARWMKDGTELPLHWHQGGWATSESYDHDYKSVPKSHLNYLLSAVPYYLIDDMCFVHGGIMDTIPLEEHHPEYIMWDRSMVYAAKVRTIVHPVAKTIFCGHTNTYALGGEDKPLFLNNVIALDTGSGWKGRLSIMDIHTKEYWQSDFSTIEEDRFVPDFEFTFGKIHSKETT